MMSKSLSDQELREYQNVGMAPPEVTRDEDQSWIVIAVKKDPRNFWIPTEECPYLDERYPLEQVRHAVEQGYLIIAQKKIGPFHYELWATKPEMES